MTLSPVISKPIEFLESIGTNVYLPDSERNLIPLITKEEFGTLKALGGYIKRDGLFGLITTVIHRIWNAVKAIFGQSDWQVAEKTVETLIKRVVLPFANGFGISQECIDTSPLLQPNHPEFKKTLREFLESAVNEISIANQKVKVVEEALLPYIDEFLNMLDKQAIGEGLYNLQHIVGRIRGLDPSLLRHEKFEETFEILQDEKFINCAVRKEEAMHIRNAVLGLFQ